MNNCHLQRCGWNVTLGEVRKRQILCNTTYTWNLNYDTSEIHMQNRNRLTDIENKLIVTKAGGREGHVKHTGLTNSNYYT